MEKIATDFFEKSAWQAGQLVVGVDEVGRGCLAGPVVTAAVILHPGMRSDLMRDSKVMTPKQRMQAAAWIRANSWYSIGMASHHIIDECNIYQATLIAMRRALLHLFIKAPIPSQIVIDAMPVTLTGSAFAHIPIYHAPFGESWSSSIAAASIIAKVYRDELMTRYHALFPAYALAAHKGYATQVHRAAVKAVGASVIHRDSFVHTKQVIIKKGIDEQRTIC